MRFSKERADKCSVSGDRFRVVRLPNAPTGTSSSGQRHSPSLALRAGPGPGQGGARASECS